MYLVFLGGDQITLFEEMVQKNHFRCFDTIKILKEKLKIKKCKD